MSDSAIQQKIVQLARQYGLNPGNLTTEQYTRFSLMARTTVREKIEAATAAGASLARTRLLGMKVTPEVAASNKAVCEKCPDKQYRMLADNSPACGACGCSGRFLISKWVDPMQACPKGHWTNVGMPTVSAKKISNEKSAGDGLGDAFGEGKVE